MYTLGEGGGKLNIRGLDHSGSETFINVIHFPPGKEVGGGSKISLPKHASYTCVS